MTCSFILMNKAFSRHTVKKWCNFYKSSSCSFFITSCDSCDSLFHVSAHHRTTASIVLATFLSLDTDADDVNPMTSSVASSNYGNLATSNPGNPGVASSDYEIPHRFTLNLGYKHEFFDGYNTRFNLFGEAYKGLPYSFTFNGSDSAFGDANSNRSRQLLYVPLENDPNVIYDMSADEINEFNDFIASEGLKRGEIAGRNQQNSDWFVKFNFKITQELPGFMDGHKGEAFFVIDNLTNMLNDDWGVLRKGSFVGNRMLKVKTNDQGQYVYSDFSARSAEQSVQRDASLWEMRVGVRYTF